MPQAADDYAKWFLARAKAVEPALAGDFICAGRFTAADISVGYAFMLAGTLGLADDLQPNARRYWAGLQEQPSFARAMARQTEAAKAAGLPAGI